MQSVLSEPGPEVWTQIAPLLDDALGQLGEKDHNAVVLRFFENQTNAQVAAALATYQEAYDTASTARTALCHSLQACSGRSPGSNTRYVRAARKSRAAAT